MDIEPIYCAEQIVVPPELADVLKVYTKEVIRQQPENLLEFSALYFANLAHAAGTLDALSPPTKQQLANVYARLCDTPAVPAADLLAACSSAGISADTVTRVLSVSQVQTDKEVVLAEALLLLLTIACEDFKAVVKGCFDVFGLDGRIETQLMLQLLASLGAKDRDNVSEAVQQEAAKVLEGVDDVSYGELEGVPLLWKKLGGSS